MLDPATMLFMTAVATTAGGLLLLTCCRRADASAMVVWAVAMIVASAGLVAAAINRDHEIVLESIATATLLTASGLFWTATRIFRGAPGRWLWVAAGPLFWLTSAPVRTDTPGWTAMSCAIGAAYTCLSVRELHRTRAEMLPSWTLGMVLMVAHTCVYAGRAALAASGVLFPRWVLPPEWIVPALITEAMVHINGMALVLVALLLERHESRASQTLRAAAYVDGLTGIANRRRFDEHIGGLASDRRLASTQIGLILLDLDHFKSVNDSAGHEEGDRVLRTVAQLIAGEIRSSSSDLAVRYGGEEFAVILKQTSLADARRVAERIRAVVADAAILHCGTGGIVTVSGGVEVLPAGLLRLRDVLIGQADRALYEAKRRGRNQIVASSDLEGGRLLFHPLSGAA